MKQPTLYLPRESGLHALHPLTKLALVGLLMVAAATLPDIGLVLAVYVLGLIPLAVWGGALGPFLRSSALLIWPFALSLFLIQGFFAPGEHILFHLGPLAFKLEGAQLAASFTARILVWLGSAALLMMVVRPDALMLALVERGLPRQIAYIILTSMQIIPRFQARALVILDAQRSRGLETEGRLMHRLRMLVPLAVPLILSSLLELDERAMALEARAFSKPGPRTSLMNLPDTAFQAAARWVMLALMLLLISITLAEVFSS